MNPPEHESGTVPRFHLALRGGGVQLPIIGVDLLSQYGLLDDCRNNHLLDGVISLSAPGHTTPPSVPSVKVIACGKPP